MWPAEIASLDRCCACFTIRDDQDPVMCEKVDHPYVTLALDWETLIR
jgi:hypothetical protein